MSEIKRNLYLKKIRFFYNSEFIKIILGVKRSGKSVLVKQIYDEILNDKSDEKNIIDLINLEDYSNRNLRDPNNLNNFLEATIIKEK